MKKLFEVSALALTALFAVSCGREATQTSSAEQSQAQEQVSNVPMVHLTFKTSDPSTKTEIGKITDENEAKVIWSDDDKIMIYVGTDGYESTYAPTDTSDFSVDVPVSKFINESGDTVDVTVFAVYPYTAAVSATSEGIITANIPSEQDAISELAVGTSLPNNISVATGEISIKGVGDLTFLNACSIIKIKAAEPTTGQSLSKASAMLIRGKANEALTGESTISISGDDVSTEAKTSYVKINGSFEAGKSYYAWVAPGALSDGFTVEYMYQDGDNEVAMMKYESSSSVTLERSSVVNLGEAAASEAAYKWELVDGTNVLFTAGETYAFAQPTAEDNTLYRVMSFQKMFDNIINSSHKGELTTKTDSASDDYYYIKTALDTIFRHDATVGNYEYVGAESNDTGAPLLGMYDEWVDDIQVVTAEKTNGTSAYVRYDGYYLGLDSLSVTTDETTHATTFAGTVSNTGMVNLYKGLRGDNSSRGLQIKDMIDYEWSCDTWNSTDVTVKSKTIIITITAVINKMDALRNGYTKIITQPAMGGYNILDTYSSTSTFAGRKFVSLSLSETGNYYYPQEIMKVTNVAFNDMKDGFSFNIDFNIAKLKYLYMNDGIEGKADRVSDTKKENFCHYMILYTSQEWTQRWASKDGETRRALREGNDPLGALSLWEGSSLTLGDETHNESKMQYSPEWSATTANNYTDDDKKIYLYHKTSTMVGK